MGWLLRIPRAKPFLGLLAFALVDELAVEALHVFVFAGAPRPLAGWARVGWHLETALVLGWPAALAATCVRVFGAVGSCFGTSNEAGKEELRRRARLTERAECGRAVADNVASTKRRPSPLLAGLYLGALVGSVVSYPLPRGVLATGLHVWEALCVGLAWWGVRSGWGRRWGRVEVALVVLVSCETMIATVGPFASDPFARWWIGGCFYLAAWGGVGVVLRPHKKHDPPSQ